MDKPSAKSLPPGVQAVYRYARSFRLFHSPRAMRIASVLSGFVVLFLFFGLLPYSGTHVTRDRVLPGDLDPPFLQTSSRRCPAHVGAHPRRVLSSVSNPFMTAMRINFNLVGRSASSSKETSSSRFNPSILPLPYKSSYPYIGFTSQEKGNVYELYSCFLTRGQKAVSKQVGLQCATEPVKIVIQTPESGECREHIFLGLRSGPQTPRVFFSPEGAPLLTYSANSVEGCIGVWMVDLRAVYPSLTEYFPNPKIEYIDPVELRRPEPKREMEQNWSLMFIANKTFIQQDLYPRTFSSIGWQTRNLAPRSFKCLNALVEKKESTVLRQATNTLRLSLCEFPCTPTEDNTVLISIIHVKYQEGYRPYYERRVLMTKATFPFDVIGVSPPLIYAGVDEQALLYTTTIAYDSRQAPRKDREKVYDMNLEKYMVRTAVSMPSPESEDESESAEDEKSESQKSSTEKKEEKEKKDKRSLGKRLEEKKLKQLLSIQQANRDQTKVFENWEDDPQLKGLESDYYHGYLNDVVLINFGIDDRESAVLDVRASDLVECVKKCLQ
ncbi:hypothetical protein BZA70DRAFT_282989 [Myxozyma melibiosi]|uniref:Uncharacterized protein n=1 Tax=Myxozyma melibiosi TaxID=54550 RepID=A0ABR1F1D2_9ASCO